MTRLFRPLRCRPKSRASGLTAVELMVVVTIVSLLAALALPSFDLVVERYRVRRALEELRTSIYLARSEAISRGGNITLRSAASPECTPPGRGEWSCGWLLFVDSNANGIVDAGERQIQAASVPKGVVARISTGAGANDFVKFSRWGDIGSLALSFRLYSRQRADDTLFSSMLCISAGGRINAIHGATQCAG